jgi:hypothetical protein
MRLQIFETTGARACLAKARRGGGGKSFGGVMGLSSLSCTDVGTDRLALREWRSERCPTLPDCRQSPASLIFDN